LVDTNVLFDVVTDDPIWADWSARQLRIASARETLIVNPVVYARAVGRLRSGRRGRCGA
jgi:predicted nucleic acid-binding protein